MWKVEDAWIWKIKKKHYVKIDRDTTSEQVLALLDAVESDVEGKIDHLMNNWYRDYHRGGNRTREKWEWQ